MAECESETGEETGHVRTRRPRHAMWRWRISMALLGLLLIAIGTAWFSRERLAGNFIQQQLDQMGLEASYDIERIGGTRQVVSNLVVGDPARPDLTAERVTIILRYRLGWPTVGRVELEKPRLYGSFNDGVLSFGKLDKVIFKDTGEPPGLPDLDVKIVDGRGLLVTDYGPVGIKLQGEGEVDSGFKGMLAASAPNLDAAGCSADRARLFGKLTTKAGKPTFDGPIRLQALECQARGVQLRSATFETALTGDSDLVGGEAKVRLASGAGITPWFAANGANGTLEAVYRKDRLNVDYNLAMRSVSAAAARAAVLTAEGNLRGSSGFKKLEVQAEIEGNGLRLGDGLVSSMANFEFAAANTLLAPLLAKARSALIRESRGSSASGEVTFRSGENGTSLIIPSASLQGRSGATILSLSRVQFGTSADGIPRFLGNFQTGGPGLPRIVGRMERIGDGDPLIRMKMAEYSQGTSSLAIPELVVAQSPGGRFGFSGRIEASGTLPGGAARNLVVPVNGNWSRSGGLSMWRNCTTVKFDRLELANLVLDQRRLTLCPSRSGAILRSDASGLKLAAGMPSLDVAGRLGDTPITIRSGPIGFAWPGNMSARNLEITLGPAGTDTRFRVANLDAQIGRNISGNFDDADVRLYAVPMDLLNAAGRWSFANSRFAIADSSFRLVDRQEEQRFEPLVARGATLTLQNNLIDAFAELREPTTDRIVTAVDIRHNLANGAGHADLNIVGLQFDKSLQPEQLSARALGVIANAEGVITGKGRIDWNESGVTSSGQFSTDGLDFAAAFGPVKGASGTVVFSDLINLTTAPGQKLKVASINPGIEIFDGEIEFDLQGGTALSLAGGTWPFLGGTLSIQPVRINFGASEVRKYILEIRGLEAAQFIERMELGNINATGTFDGTVPLVFDEAGNGRIEGGVLNSRPPGGNLSYIGELTYKDLSTMANFAFDTLRSLDYREMQIRMDGSLTGEIVTRVRFDGVKQGAGAKSNFITRRIANLPIRFNVNIRAPFYQLITSLKAMYDPAFVRDPRELGLLSDDGTRLRPAVRGSEVRDKVTPADIIPDEPPIQTAESEKMR